AVNYGRGEPKSAILDKKSRLSPTYFAMNYESKWVGATDGALVDINKLLDLRTLSTPEFSHDGKKASEYAIGVDVARSQSESNNQTSIAVVKIKRNKEGRITMLSLVNLINLPNGLNFSAQAI